MLAGWIICMLPPLLLAMPPQALSPAGQSYRLPLALASTVLVAAGLIALLTDGRRRAPHDRLAGTEVVYQRGR
jgi:hypothetical protein